MTASVGTVTVKVVPEIDLESAGAQELIEAIASAVVKKLAEPRPVTIHATMQRHDRLGMLEFRCSCGWGPRRGSLTYHPKDAEEQRAWVAVHIDTATNGGRQ